MSSEKRDGDAVATILTFRRRLGKRASAGGFPFGEGEAESKAIVPSAMKRGGVGARRDVPIGHAKPVMVDITIGWSVRAVARQTGWDRRDDQDGTAASRRRRS